MGHLFKTGLNKVHHVSNNKFKNAWEMIKRYRVRPWGNQLINIRIKEQYFRVMTRKDGFFSLDFQPNTDERLLRVHASLDTDPEVRASGVVLVREPVKIFVSDIDDTIIVSHSTNLWKKLYLLLTKNHERRKAYHDIQDFYARICKVEENQLFFYVSSSEWNLYDFINSFCEYNKFPRGIFMLQDIKVGLLDLIRSGGGSHQHKHRKVEKILSVFDEAELTLVGDSGQRDPYIYSRLAHLYPHRIRDIYIRDLKEAHRHQLEVLARKLAEKGVSLKLFP